MTPRFRRYLLWQAPGWVAVGAALLALSGLADLPVWIVPLGVAAFVTKDMVMYRVVRHTLEPPRARLVGARGRAVERLAPVGYVRVDGELWRAETSRRGDRGRGADRRARGQRPHAARRAGRPGVKGHRARALRRHSSHGRPTVPATDASARRASSSSR